MLEFSLRPRDCNFNTDENLYRTLSCLLITATLWQVNSTIVLYEFHSLHQTTTHWPRPTDHQPLTHQPNDSSTHRIPTHWSTDPILTHTKDNILLKRLDNRKTLILLNKSATGKMYFGLFSIWWITLAFNVGLSPSKNNLFYMIQWNSFKNDENCFLFHLQSFFPSLGL